jgi:hypothetical protein
VKCCSGSQQIPASWPSSCELKLRFSNRLKPPRSPAVPIVPIALES